MNKCKKGKEIPCSEMKKNVGQKEVHLTGNGEIKGKQKHTIYSSSHVFVMDGCLISLFTFYEVFSTLILYDLLKKWIHDTILKMLGVVIYLV